eukprot:EG_transcript_17766
MSEWPLNRIHWTSNHPTLWQRFGSWTSIPFVFALFCIVAITSHHVSCKDGSAFNARLGPSIRRPLIRTSHPHTRGYLSTFAPPSMHTGRISWQNQVVEIDSMNGSFGLILKTKATLMSGVLFIFGILIWKFSQTSWASNTIAVASTSGVQATVSRRNILAGASAVGLVANKVAIEGPPVYTPPGGFLSGRKILITGGNHGLGFESAVRLAKGGATVIITARTSAKGEAAVAQIKEMSGNSDINFIVLDLADLQSVRKCAKEFEEKYGILNVLMNNAGVMAIPQRQVTADGFEKQFGINHLGHFALTGLLQASLLRGAGSGHSRVINVSSAASYLTNEAAFDFDGPGGIMA